MEDRIRLKPELREILRRPLGNLIRANPPSAAEIQIHVSRAQKLISVGDATTENLLRVGIIPSIQIIDQMEKRKIRRGTIEGLSKRKRSVKNPAGSVTFEAVLAIRELMQSDDPILLQVEGEEDLLALPSIALSPIGGAVAYGQPDEGMVVVRIDRDSKWRAEEMLRGSGLPVDLLKY